MARKGFLLLGSIFRPDRPSVSSVTGSGVRPKMVLGEVPEASVMVLALALVVSTNLKLWLLF